MSKGAPVKRSLGLMLFSVLMMPARPTAAAVFSDQLCPAAVDPVQRYTAFVNDPKALADDAVAAANRIAAVYDLCATGYRANGNIELVHYAEVRSAQYHFAAGRLLRLEENNDAARAAFAAALQGVRETIDWKQSSQSYRSSNGTGGTSVGHNSSSLQSSYYSSAVSVRDAVQAEMAEMAKPAAASPAPSSKP